MESLEFRLRSLISSIQSNLRLLDAQKVKEKDSQTDCGTLKAKSLNQLLMENEFIRGCLLEEGLVWIPIENEKNEYIKCLTDILRCHKENFEYRSGVMGVPITFLDKYNPEQFIIIGHEHDVNGNGGIGVREGEFEINGIGKYKRILIKSK